MPSGWRISRRSVPSRGLTIELPLYSAAGTLAAGLTASYHEPKTVASCLRSDLLRIKRTKTQAAVFSFVCVLLLEFLAILDVQFV